MPIEKKTFTGGMNGDINLRLLPQEQYLNLMNARMAISENGRNLRIENINGTLFKTNNKLPPYGIHQTIGSTSYIHTDGSTRVVFANWNSSGDNGIYVYDVTNDVFYAVVYDSQIIGGLNFSKNYRINRNMKVLGGILYFCEGTNNQPRAISIEAGIKANQSSYVTDVLPYQFPLDWTNITLIRKPPALAPNFTLQRDNTTNNNFIATQSFQFAYSYIYYTNEESVVGAYSPATRLLFPTDTGNNCYNVTMDVLEQIPSTVKIVQLIVRLQDGQQGGGNIAKVIKTWNKEIQAERNEIINQNNGTQPLSFVFYNNIQGKSIPEANVLKPFDSVPLYAKTLENARNRNHLGNIVDGYDAPTTTSLSSYNLTIGIGGTTISKNLILLLASWQFPSHSYSAWYVFINSGEINNFAAGYYAITSTEQFNGSSSIPPTPPAAPASVAVTGLTFRGANQHDVGDSINIAGGNLGGSLTTSYTFTSTPCPITGATLANYSIFKTDAQYKMGVVFYDFAMRKCGVVTNDTCKFETPKHNYQFNSGVGGVVWQLSNTNALVEIPDWAYYYSVVRTLNLRTRFFIDSFTNQMKYAVKDANGQYQFNATIFPFNCAGLGLSTGGLTASGLGYTFSEGDVANIIFNNGDTAQLPVIGQDGEYIIVKAKDLGDLSNRQATFEIFTPYKTSDQEFFYEIGQIYKINLPTTNSRTYNTLADMFLPDCYAILRNYGNFTYFAEAMCPNDLYYQRWDNDGGKVNIVTLLGQANKTQFGRYSNTYIPNTSTNGLSTFDALDQYSVGESCGAIQNFVLTNKVQDKGTVMLAICTNETSSIYLGESQTSDGTGQTKFLAISTGVVGTINDLKGSLGTIHPESVISYLGLVFWFDALNGVMAQYSSAGLDVVSNYGQARFFKNYAKDYLAANSNNLDNINGYHHLSTAIDPFHKELLFNACGLIYENYADIYPSYSSVPSYATSIINRMDVYDRLQKSMAFAFEKNNWGSNYEYSAEWYENVENKLFSFKEGQLYLHEGDNANYNTFYGAYKPVRLCFTGNFNPSALKVLNNIAIEGNVIPNFTVALTAHPNQQITDLSSADFTDQEGNYYAYFLFDRLSPNSVGNTPDKKLYAAGGDPLTDIAIQVMCEFPSFDRLIYINAINLGYSYSRGQKQILQPVN